MYDFEVEELEQKWKKYRVKRVMPYVIGSATLIVVSILGVLFYPYIDKELGKKAEPEVKEVLVDASRVNTTKGAVASTSGAQSVELNPEIIVPNNVERPKERPKKSYSAPKPKPIHLDKDIPKEKKIDITFSATKSSSNSNVVKFAGSVSNDELESKFEKTPNINVAILISRRYFNAKEYKEAIKWAMKANKLNNSNEESWVLYAKAAYYLGRKDKATEALTIYLKKYESNQARRLLESIKKGSL